MPEASVIRGLQTLSGFTGRKEYVGGDADSLLKTLAQPGEGREDHIARSEKGRSERAVEQ